jgi:hypothetical protein
VLSVTQPVGHSGTSYGVLACSMRSMRSMRWFFLWQLAQTTPHTSLPGFVICMFWNVSLVEVFRSWAQPLNGFSQCLPTGIRLNHCQWSSIQKFFCSEESLWQLSARSKGLLGSGILLARQQPFTGSRSRLRSRTIYFSNWALMIGLPGRGQARADHHYCDISRFTLCLLFLLNLCLLQCETLAVMYRGPPNGSEGPRLRKINPPAIERIERRPYRILGEKIGKIDSKTWKGPSHIIINAQLAKLCLRQCELKKNLSKKTFNTIDETGCKPWPWPWPWSSWELRLGPARTCFKWAILKIWPQKICYHDTLQYM